MTHNSTCETSRKKVCLCECEGAFHSVAYDKEEREKILGEKLMVPSMGGQIAEFLKASLGVEYYCLGIHNDNMDRILGVHNIDMDRIHVANEFYGYPHEGGLSDEKGNKWWVFVYCDEPVKSGVPHQTSFVHFPGEVKRAKMIKGEA